MANFSEIFNQFFKTKLIFCYTFSFKKNYKSFKD